MSDARYTLTNQCAAEALGTFALVIAGTGAIVTNHVSGGAVTHVGIALTFGLIVMALIYAIGDVSGAHLNPAVSFGFWLAGRFPGRCVAPYVMSQLVGALAASGLLRLMFGNVAHLGATIPAGGAMQSFVLETVLTGLLMFVVLCVACGPKEVGVMAGIAVGGVIALEALFAGPISGASMNPVRSLAPALVSWHLADVWVYLSAPVVGAAVAVPCWWAIRGRPATPVAPCEET
ncbi:MAG TPA: aquaporin [Tepidisphaeraceae bacterium]|nr:aquaporin [Tepidisphaeraceae bacterium]